MRALNTQLVLDCIRVAGTASQADLIRATKLNTGTIVSIVRDLRRRGLAIEAGQGVSRGGRLPTLLRQNPSAAYVLACQVGSETAVIAVLDLDARPLARRELAIEQHHAPGPFIASLAAAIVELRETHCRSGIPVAGLGLSLHGAVDSDRGTLLVSEHLGWRDVPFAEPLRKALGIPVLAQAETRAIALAEQRWGAARDARDFVLIELDTGIGMVQVLDGTICRGRHNMAGELGFTVWDIGSGHGGNRPPRVLEEVASLRSLCRQTRALPGIEHIALPPAAADESTEEQWLRRLVLAAGHGCESAQELLDTATNALGLALANVINLLDPELVLLTGRLVSGADGALVENLRRCCERHLLAKQEHAPRIERAILGSEAALRGTASAVLDRYLGAENLAHSPPAE